MSSEIWLAFAAASALLLVIPGPTILTVISYAATAGPRACLPLVAAVALGDATALLFSLLGLGALLAASAFWFTAVKLVGGLYLLYLGLKVLHKGFAPADRKAPAPSAAAPGNLFGTTYLVTALNPKSIMFFIAFLPQFVTSGQDAGFQLWLLSATFVILAAINAAIYALCAASARRMLTSGRMQRPCALAGGSLLAAAGIWSLLARRV